MNRFKVTGLSLVFLGLIAALMSGCAVGPDIAQPPPTITINTIPSGADISIQGNYIGKSPVSIPAPSVSDTSKYGVGSPVITKYTGTEPIKIEASLEGYETKNVSFGDYHPPTDEVLTRMVETESMIYRAPVGTKTIPAFYTFRNEINIKLQPKSGGTSVPSTPHSDVQKSVFPAGVYQATRNYGNGDKYTGEFVNGQFHGKGIYTYANGDKYEGEFVNGKFTGRGNFTCSNGKRFSGNLENKVPLEFTIRCN